MTNQCANESTLILFENKHSIHLAAYMSYNRKYHYVLEYQCCTIISFFISNLEVTDRILVFKPCMYLI